MREGNTLGLEKRKANVTFLSHDSVTITNFLYQKTFTLKEPIIVDLKTLKFEKWGDTTKKENFDSPFFIIFNKAAKSKEYYGMVAYRPKKDKLEILQEEKDQVSQKNNNKNFSATVYVED